MQYLANMSLIREMKLSENSPDMKYYCSRPIAAVGPIGERAFLTAQSITFLEKTLHVSK